MIKLLEKRPILTIIIMVGLMLLPFLDVLEVTIMEARNFISAREMLTDDNWILTTMNGEPRYQKPPLPTWLTAISASVFGVKSVWGMRFPAVLMVMLLGSMVYTLSRKLELSLRHSFINGLVSVTSLYVVLIIFEAPWDIYAHAFMLTGIYFVFKNLKSQNSKGNILDWLPASLFIGGSILSKGPVSLYALFLPFVVAYIVVYRDQTARNRWLLFAGMLILGILIGFSWYAYVRYADAETFARITAKETSNWTSYNVRPFYYYWSFFVQSGLWTIPAFISLLYPYLKTRVSNLKVYRFTLLWTVLAVILLSIIPEKKSRYLMPVLIPLALNVGFYLEYLVRRFKELKDKRETVPVYFNFGLVLLAFTAVPFALIYLVVFENVVIYSVGLFAFLGMILATLFAGYSLFKKAVYHVFLGILVALMFCVTAGLSVIEGSVLNDSYKEFSAISFDDSLPLYSLQINAPEVFWGSGEKITVLNSPKDMISDQQFYLLICSACEEVILKEFGSFNSEFISDYDLNFNPKKTRAYKDRKAGKMFKMSRK